MKGKSKGHCDVPTKPRIRALLLNQGLLSPYYPVKSVIAIGIALTVCGVTMSIFGIVAYLVEASMGSLCSGVWIGILVIVSGLIGVSSGNRPHSVILLHINLFTAIFTVASSGFMTILTANCVVKDNEVEITETRTSVDINIVKTPAFMVNSLLLVVSTLTCILSFTNFCLTGREACQCYSSGGVLGLNDPLNHLGLDTLQRRDRIIAWILQQSNAPHVSASPSPESHRSPKKKLQPIHSNASTASTRLSAYEV